MSEITPAGVVGRYRQAKERRSTWESHWQECYDYALPQRDGITRHGIPGEKKTDKLFDGTAPDAVEQLAASLLAQLTPPWARWFGLTVGAEVTPEERDALAPELEITAAVLQSHFERSNFAVEMHQCYLDLVTAGTASLLFEEAAPGDASAFRFTAVPLSQVVLEEGVTGQLDTTYRRSELTLAGLRSRFPEAGLPEEIIASLRKDAAARVPVIEAVISDPPGYSYMALVESGPASGGDPTVLEEGRFARSPFINFRWLKAPGEVYGRSPVMKTLPDIKTANKVVELVLKNASIAVTGIWQADDDGVLNPATIRLVPGTIIPKAVGSAGLTPLEAPGRFDVSQIMLDDLRARIRSGLLVDKLGQITGPKMTATEVLERSADMARLLGANYGRLQSELLTPLVTRALAILGRRGEITDLAIDGRLVDLEYKSPLARNQAQLDAQNTLSWIDAVTRLGPDALAVIDQVAVARWLGRAFAVPPEFIRDISAREGDTAGLIGAIADTAAGAAGVDPAALAALAGDAVDDAEPPATEVENGARR